MEDVVDYKIPLGILGRLAHLIFVKYKVKQIFTYREKALNEIFN
jgi:ligand-binding SRPBCC domain-containing protein